MPTAGPKRAEGETSADEPEPAATRLGRTIVLVGLMGAGKTAIGRRLAVAIGVPFVDADAAIVEAAGMSIPDIFEAYGEPAFRDLERRVIARLLDDPPFVLALGGGAFIDGDTRAAVARRGTSIWLEADLDTLVERTARKKATRPLLKSGDPRSILGELMRARYPIYALADLRFQSGPQTPEQLVERIRDELSAKGLVDGR